LSEQPRRRVTRAKPTAEKAQRKTDLIATVLRLRSKALFVTADARDHLRFSSKAAAGPLTLSVVIGSVVYAFWFLLGLAVGWIPRVGVAIAGLVPVLLIALAWIGTSNSDQGLAGDAGTPTDLGIFLIVVSVFSSLLGAWVTWSLRNRREARQSE
jgi:hypothetical protein